MRYCFFVILIYRFALGLFGQDTSLIDITAIDSDTEKINVLYKKGFSLRNSDLNSAFVYARLCDSISNVCKSNKHKAKNYNLYGVLWYKKGDYRTSIQYHKQALVIREQEKDVLGIAISQTNLGNIYSDLKLYGLAETHYLSALNAYKTLNDTKQLISCIINIGVLKQEQGLVLEAREQYQHALIVANDINDYESKAICYNNIGELLSHTKDSLFVALEYHQEALKIRELMDNELEKTDSYLNIANIYLQLNNTQAAKNYLSMALSICNTYEYYSGKLFVYKQYSDVFFVETNYKEAYMWLKKYTDLKDSTDIQSQEIVSDSNDVIKTIALKNNSNNNYWLLIIIFIFVVIIPLTLIQKMR